MPSACATGKTERNKNPHSPKSNSAVSGYSVAPFIINELPRLSIFAPSAFMHFIAVCTSSELPVFSIIVSPEQSAASKIYLIATDFDGGAIIFPFIGNGEIFAVMKTIPQPFLRACFLF